MIAPKDVISPKDRWHLIEVLHIGEDPKDPDYSWSMCIGTWKERNGTSRYRIGVRWNGRGKTKGNPMSTGHPTWSLATSPTCRARAAISADPS